MKLDHIYNDQPISLAVERDGESLIVGLPGGSERKITARRMPDGMLQIADGDRVFRAAVAAIGRQTHVSFDGQLFVLEEAACANAAAARSVVGDLVAPMHGVVVDVMVRAGDRIAAGQPVAVVEAMKVMATVEAPRSGTVKEVMVEEGQRVVQGERLVEFEPEEPVDA